jgi:UDP-N-acetylglucosamine--N-acetylmuramyl-(pentapeptide) pyrophosphoryl-undecaprenol N-acetylglucosamine transferase
MCFELLALKKPSLLIPLPRAQSRGDQILNAASFEKQGFAMVMAEENLTEEGFIKAIRALYDGRGVHHSALSGVANAPEDAVERVLRVLEGCLG